jgi:hypothetical protein
MLAAIGLRQLLEHLAVELAQALALKELPFVEGGAVGQGEAGQEVVDVQLNRSVEVRQALRRGHILSGRR